MKRLFATLVISGLLQIHTAYSADVSVPHTFAAGSPAVAAQVNENFQTLANAINTLSARIYGTSCSSAITQDTDFAIISFGVGIGAGANFLHTETDLIKGDVCIKTDGSLKFSGKSYKYVEVNGPSADINQAIHTYDAIPGNDPQGELENLTGTYTLNSACELAINIDGDSIIMNMNSSLTMGVGGTGEKNELCNDGSDCAPGSGPDVGDSYFRDIILLVRKGSGATFCSTP